MSAEAGRSEAEMVAYALEAEPRVVPYLPELLADLDELGSDAELIASIVGRLELPDSPQIVDLGCGKGAVAVEIAASLGYAVKGIELFAPFLRSCEALAISRDVSRLCSFVEGNIASQALIGGTAGVEALADVAIFAALGDVLGTPDVTMSLLRQYVKPGGFVVISDPILKPGGKTDFPGFEHYLEQAETERRLLTHGDQLVSVYAEPFVEFDAADDDDWEDEDEDELVSARARDLAQTLESSAPEDARAVLEFARSQQAENEYIDENLIDVVWVIRKR